MDGWIYCPSCLCAHTPHEVQSLLLDAARCCPTVLKWDTVLVDEGDRAVDSGQRNVCPCQVHQVWLEVNVHFLT